MLLNLREYHRPSAQSRADGVAKALVLLSRAGLHTVPLAGGDLLLGSADTTVDAVVDLQGLGLDGLVVDEAASALRIGAMATRTSLANWAALRDHGCGVVADAAREWRGSIQRNRDTVGGAVVHAASEDPLPAALLVCGAWLTIQDVEGERRIPLETLLAGRDAILSKPALITELVVPIPRANTGSAMTKVSRTPADRPIVLAVAMVRVASGVSAEARLALGGVDTIPILVGAASQLIGRPLTLEDIAQVASRASQAVEPKGDERGSARYRRAMAEVLSRRALCEAWSRC